MPRRGRPLVLLAAFLAGLAAAPGAHATDAQDRIGAFPSAAHAHAGAITCESPCTRPGSTLPSAGIAAGCCVAAKKGPDKFGPFHRREGPQTADEMAKARAGQLDEVQGGVNRGGYRPSVDAHTGPLPPGQRGYEFFTPVPPRRGTAPGWAQWPLGHPGVRDLGNDRVAIPCRVVRCR
jgi:hypothetical protein